MVTKSSTLITILIACTLLKAENTTSQLRAYRVLVVKSVTLVTNYTAYALPKARNIKNSFNLISSRLGLADLKQYKNLENLRV